MYSSHIQCIGCPNLIILYFIALSRFYSTYRFTTSVFNFVNKAYLNVNPYSNCFNAEKKFILLKFCLLEVYAEIKAN